LKPDKIILIIVFVFFKASLLRAEEHNFKDIVLLNYYHPTFKWTADITDGILKEFSDPSKYRVFVEYMDSTRFHNKQYIEQLSHIYAHKYSASTIDGVIVSDNNAFDFFLKYGNGILGNVPVAFCGNNNIEDYHIDTTRFKGVDEKINIDSTLHVIKMLQPELEQLIVISDSTISGLILSNQFLHAVQTNHNDLNYELVYASSADQLATTLNNICSGKKALFLNGSGRWMKHPFASLEEQGSDWPLQKVL
jgi:hypothetical protein